MLQARYDKGKTIFRNILWDADGSGSDVFTFAYYDGISYDATPTPSSCENGVPRNDGYIDIGINIGTPVYSYVLSVDTVAGKVKGETIARGTFFGDTHRITNLAPAPMRCPYHKVEATRFMPLATHSTPHTHMTPGPICPATSHGR